ncbi:hypothetical protein GH5_02143 [Leishmania sp. Ghana 2012 LV757]|uniref:hypothetical protein n=1 Tax=Leishmania sp. Ghana 2012 LV757 TaxID=2803181 RepID=UPI001B750613|nr:hypothetical protein GH5_02143 [Leishmania sp. Ghana 2012 LV757]
MESQVMSLLNSRSLLTVAEAAMQLGVPEGEMQPIFASIAASHDEGYTLLSRSIEEAASGNATAIVMYKSAGLKANASADALLSLTYPSNVAPSSLPVQLCPSAAVSLREYPVVSRAVMETRPDATPSLPPPAAPPSLMVPPAAAAAPSEAELTHTEDSQPAATLSSAVTPVASPVLPLAQEESPQGMLALVTTTAQREETAPRAPSPLIATSTAVTLASSPKATIFDKMKEAAAAKRPRTCKAPAKPMREQSKPGKVAKMENTTSLAKLARASKKQKNGIPAVTGAASAPSSMSFLDDDGDVPTHLSHSEVSSSSHVEAMVNEDLPTFDVFEAPASNDEVIMCDDAPPLAFRSAAPLPSRSTPTPHKKEPEAKKASSAAAAADTTQSKLASFFNAAVVEFQKSYVREIETEMRVENGEFVCCDFPCYKHSSTGEVISEDEYHQRTAAFIRSNSHDAAVSTPNRMPATPSVESPRRTTAAQKPEKTAAAPAKTLLSFFRPSSA